MFISKKIIHLFLLIICIENSLTYPIEVGGFKSAVIWIWDEGLRHPIPSGIISSITATIILDILRQSSKAREVENNKNISETKLIDAETEMIQQQKKLESRPDWQEAQIKLMAAEAFEKMDQTLMQQRKAKDNLDLEERKLRLRERKVQVINSETGCLDYLQKKVNEIKRSLQDESLSEEQQRDLYTKLIRLKGLNSSIAT